MKRFLALPILVAMACTNSSVAAAQLLEELLVTGSYAPQPELTASLTVLDQQGIQALNKRSLAEVFRTVPGLLVEQQGGPGGLTAVSIRGAESNFTLVLLDGVPVNDPTNTRGGGFDFANLNPAVVERIEIVRGAQSAVYGSDALAGVINIVTLRPDEGHSEQIGAEWGEDDFANYFAAAQGAGESWSYSMDFSHRDDGEPVPGSTRENDTANVRLGWKPAEAHSLYIGYRYLDGERTSYPEQSGGPEYAASDDLDASDYRDEVISLGWMAQFTPGWQSSLTANRFDHEDEYFSPGIAPYDAVPPNAAATDFRRDQLQWVNALDFGSATEWLLGADYRDEEGESEGYLEFFGMQIPTDFELERSTVGLFASVSNTSLHNLLLQGSVRYDDPDDFDSETSFSAGARYELSPAVAVRVNWGEAFKLPSFFALGHPLVGNQDLTPETATSWDLGIDWKVSERLNLGATGFFNDYEDLIDFDSETFRNVNRKNIETSGVELQAAWGATDRFAINGQATWTDIDVKGEDTVLTGRPEWVASLVASWQIADQWQTTLDYRYTGEQWAVSRHTGQDETSELDSYHRIDWVLHWNPVEHWYLQLSADNLFDEDYENSVGFPAPGRSFRLGIRYGN
jgi:vitamin B12 transporter